MILRELRIDRIRDVFVAAFPGCTRAGALLFHRLLETRFVKF